MEVTTQQIIAGGLIALVTIGVGYLILNGKVERLDRIGDTVVKMLAGLGAVQVLQLSGILGILQ
jgi:hypothetical protein